MRVNLETQLLNATSLCVSQCVAVRLMTVEMTIAGIRLYVLYNMIKFVWFCFCAASQIDKWQ